VASALGNVLAAAALASATLLAACAGGGRAAPAPRPVASGAATAPPASNVRVPVGSGRLTLKLPPALRAGSTIVRAASSTPRAPRYVNPLPNTIDPKQNLYNTLDIYVDNTLVANLDGNFPNNDHTMFVVNTADATQTLSVPLYSASNNDVVAIEWDWTENYVLGIGETQLAGQVSPGSTQDFTLTMLMQAYYTGIVDLPNLSTPALIGDAAYYLGVCGGPLTSSAFGLYPADAEQGFVPIAGYGGTSISQITAVIPLSGTTKIVQSAAGSYYVSWDAGCDGVRVEITSPNPAYAVWNDVLNANYWDYYNAYYSGGIGGPYQGIWNVIIPLNRFPQYAPTAFGVQTTVQWSAGSVYLYPASTNTCASGRAPQDQRTASC
jgi:hypothetical protein